MKFLFFVLTAMQMVCVPGATAAAQGDPTTSPPALLREARAVWIASVDNIDWPSKAGLPVAQQKAELIAMLDRAKQLNLNIVILQIRPGCDALYESKIEPWSEYLTGKMGVAPSPFYDPLAFAINEAHRRGLELHAWFNPFRARYNSRRGEASPEHVSHTKPEWVKKYGDYMWLDPADREAREYSMSVFMDVLRRYDVDGIHIDDYFYPYQVRDKAGKLVDFPDGPSWERYQASGGKLSRGDWRRENINQWIEQLYKQVKAEKSWVKVGISPFGIWRPGSPPQIQGLDAYESLYADARKWLTNGWLDYAVPQLYWSISATKQSYPVLLQWWHEQNEQQRHLWPGNSVYRTGKKEGVEEVFNQIQLTRKQPGATGNVLWSMKCLMCERGTWATEMAQALYNQPALVPASPWLSDKRPGPPIVKAVRAKNSLSLTWKAGGNDPVQLWTLQKKSGGQWTTEILPFEQTSYSLTNTPSAALPEEIAIVAINRFGQASAPAVFRKEDPTRSPRATTRR